MSYHKPRPTTYAGVQMRSRLEAEFAAFCDKHGVPWKYEPHCYANATGQYLPDFWVMDGKGEVKTEKYLEIKPQGADVEAALKRMHIILDTLPDAHLVVVQPTGGWADGRYPGFGPAARCSPVEPCGRCHREQHYVSLRHAMSDASWMYRNPVDHLKCPVCGDEMSLTDANSRHEKGALVAFLSFTCNSGHDLITGVWNADGMTMLETGNVSATQRNKAKPPQSGAHAARAALAAARARKGRRGQGG